MDKKIRMIWWGLLGMLLTFAFIKFLIPVQTPAKFEQARENQEIVIYITGAVQKPGLYHLPLDARMEDALQEAVLRSDADQEALNPAQKLKDGQKVIIPYQEKNLAAININAEENQSAADNQNTPNTAVNSKGNKVNINTANLGELDSIPGIGPVLAQRIIDYREQNGFYSCVEDIQEVSGIGPKTFEKMSEFLSVGP